MGKNQSASGLTNIIQYDNKGNVSFVSGSTTLMQISSSGAITTTGVISGSNALSASYALNSGLLNGTGSVGFATTGGFATASGSISTRVTQIENVYATTGSNSFRANQSITGSLVVSSTITAQTLVVQTITSSVEYSSGSNIFGSALTNTQTFTGSLNVTGSSHSIFGNVGIGTSSPNSYTGYTALTINNTTTGAVLDLNRSGTRTGTFYADTSGVGIGSLTATNLDIFTGNSYIDFQTSGSERMRITSGGITQINGINGAVRLTLQNSDNTGYVAFTDQEIRMWRPNASGADLTIATQAISGTLGSGAITFNPANVERMRISGGGCVGIGNTAPTYQLDMCSGTTVNQRIRLQRGSDDTNQNMLLGWNNITLTRSNVSIAGNQTDFSVIQCGSDGIRTPFYIGVGGNACFSCGISTGVTGCNMIFTQDAAGGYIENFGNTSTKSVIRIQTSKCSNLADYSQFIIDPFNGFGFRALNGGSTNVGIGTLTPSYRLEIQKTNAQTPGIFVNQCSADEATIRFKSTHSCLSDFRIGASILVGSAFEIYNVQGNISNFIINCNGFSKMSNNGTFVNGTQTMYHTMNNSAAGAPVLYTYHTDANGSGILSNVQACNTSVYSFRGYSDPYGEMGLIYSNGTFGSRTGTYGGIISDARCKTEICDASSQWSDIKNLRVRNFKLIEDVEKNPTNALRQIGFIAQEVETVSPGLVFESSNVDVAGCWKNVKTSIIHTKAVKALQEAMCRIEILESCLGIA